ncbi:MAG: TonB-dependent receptor, partial [Candidatus Marinimicrobia bacterium]|nr:TonB-dependent receptor [Candidatus Neomarinimicrobiota bacterium]
NFDDIVWDDHRELELADTTLTLPRSNDIINAYLEHGVLDSAYQGLSNYWDQVVGPDGRTINPLDQYEGWTALGWNNSWNFFAKVNWKFSNTIQLRFTELASQRFRQINNYNAWYVYGMASQNVQLQKTHKEALILNHTLSANSFYTVQLSQFYSDRKVRILKDYTDIYASSINVFDTWDGNIKSPEEHVPYLSGDAILDPFESRFYLVADNRWYSGDVSNTREFRFDFTSQYHQLHKFEFGVNYTHLDIDYHSHQNTTGPDNYPTLYHYKPKEAASYLQHKSELDLLVLNLGIRVDYLDPVTDAWEDPLDPLGTQIGNSDTLDYNNISDASIKVNLSPRIGIAYPLTDKSVIYFNFGHFYQNPNYRDLYRASGDNREISLVRGNIMGNPNLVPEKAIQYELGFQQQIGDNVGIKANLWAKETTNQVGSVVVPAYSDEGRDNPFTYSIFVNNNFGSARGAELSVNYQFKPQSVISLDYTLSESKVLHATSWDGYWSGDTEENLPKAETRAPWDQTHVFRASLRYAFRHHEGFSIGSVYPLENSMLILMYYGESGLPYTPSISGGVVTEPYSERWDSSHRIDMKVVKSMKSFKGNIQVYFEVKNLLNRQNIITGYTLTGSPENPGTSDYYTRSSTYWDSRNNNNYGLERIIYWGVEYAL